MDKAPPTRPELESLLLRAMDKTADGFAIFDTADRVLFCNAAFARLFDYEAGRACGQRFSDLVRHVYRTRHGLNVEAEDVEAWLDQAQRKRRSTHYRAFEVDTCDGRWFLLTEQLLDDGHLFIVCTEVTARKRAEDQLHRLSDELKVLAETDSLTGLSNRRHYLQQAEHELARSRRLARPLALAVLDVDHFKRINDRYGHQVGDRALQAIAKALGQVVRPYDIVGRIGGEEFAVLLSEAPCRESRRIAERLRQEVDSIDCASLPAGLKLSLSIGLACIEIAPPDSDLDKLIARADQALYVAKRTGRNRVICTCEAVRMGPSSVRTDTEHAQ